MSSGPVVVTAADREEARALYTARCAACHGADGRGDGGQVRDLRDATWQRSVTDDRLSQVIRFGGEPYGLSARMPAQPDLLQRPALVKALVEQVRAMEAVPPQ